MHRTKWFLPLFSLVLGAAVWAAAWIGAEFGLGAAMFGIMAATGALVLLGGRSETVRGLRGDGRDERFAQLDLRATAFAGMTVIAFLVELARGHDGMPYAWLGAIGGLSYVVGVIVGRVRG